ncbi:MAG: DUF45 domain-containing protein [Clostridia bacterium]|nr:DUF45 domain-containing protein [Clostridia bacterium]
MYFQYRGRVYKATRRSNSRRLTITVHKNSDLISLNIPPWAGKKDIEEFLDKQEAWLEERVPKFRDDIWVPMYASGERHLVFGRYVTLGIDDVPCGEKAFITWRLSLLEQEIRKLLPAWCNRMKLPLPRVTIRKMSSQWGSCRVRSRSITLNSQLALYPPDCLEMVLVHELNHMYHPDHSVAFYRDMDRYLPSWRTSDRTLETMDISPKEH